MQLALCAVVLTLASCHPDDEDAKIDSRLSFRVVSRSHVTPEKSGKKSAPAEGMGSFTRVPSQAIACFEPEEGSDEPALYLHLASVTPIVDNLATETIEIPQSATRGAIITTDNFGITCPAFDCDIYQVGGTSKYLSMTLEKSDERPSRDYPDFYEYYYKPTADVDAYWPSGKQLFFNCYYPSELQPTSMNIANPEATFSYTVPTSNGANTDAEAQPDAIMAITDNYSLTTNSEGVTTTIVQVRFAHTLCAVVFRVGTISNTNLRFTKVTLSNLHGSGTTTATRRTDQSPLIAQWTPTDAADKSYSQTFDCLVDGTVIKPRTSTLSGSYIDTTSVRTHTFHLLPQLHSVDGGGSWSDADAKSTTEITIEYTVNGSPRTRTAKFPASMVRRASDSTTPQQFEWEPGWLYTYALSVSEKDFDIDVAVNDWVDGGSADRTVWNW